MADFAALTIQLGAQRQIQDTNFLQVGGGIKPRPPATNMDIFANGGAIILNDNTTVLANKNITAQAGTSALDFSLGTGIFSTSTGTNTINGAMVFAANKGITVTAGTSAFDFSGGTGIFKTSTGAVTIGNGVTTMSGVTTFTAAGVALTVNNNALISGNLIIGGNLTVSGTTTTTHSETVTIDDNNLYLNSNYTTAAAQTGGLTINYLPTATATTVNAAYVAGVAAVSNPTVGTVGAATFAAGDFIQFGGAIPSTNNTGLYEVLSHAANVLTVRGIGTTATVEDFTQNQFVAGASDGASITKVTVSVIRAGTDGIWETGKGAVTPVTFVDLANAAGSVTLQSAYETGNTITTTVGFGNVTIAGTEDFVLAGTVDAAWTTTGGFTSIAMTGAVNLTTTSTLTMVGGAGATFGDDTGTISFNGSGFLTSSGLAVISLISSGVLTLTGGGASSLTTTAGALTITSAAAATWKTAAGLLTVEGAAGIQLNGGAGTSFMTIGVTANQLQVQAGRTLSTTGTGNINLPNNGSALFQIEGVGVSANVTAANLGTLTAGPASNADALHTHTTVTASNLGVPGTSGEAIAAGAPVLFDNAAGVPRVFNADANGAGELVNVMGVNLTAVGAAALAVTMIVAGRVAVPDAQFDALPAVGDVGKVVYLSENVGLLTLTAPTTTGSTVCRVGWVSQGGTGAVTIVVGIGTPTIL